jgi:hypothetical protein
MTPWVGSPPTSKSRLLAVRADILCAKLSIASVALMRNTLKIVAVA